MLRNILSAEPVRKGELRTQKYHPWAWYLNPTALIEAVVNFDVLVVEMGSNNGPLVKLAHLDPVKEDTSCQLAGLAPQNDFCQYPVHRQGRRPSHLKDPQLPAWRR